MSMTDSQFKGFVSFVLDDIKEVFENLENGKQRKGETTKSSGQFTADA